MRHLAALILTVAFFAAFAHAQDTKPIKPASSFSLSEITFISPDQPEWKLAKSEASEILLEKRAKDEVMNARVKILKTKTFQTESDTQRGLEALKNEEVNTPNRDSLHYYYVRFKGMSCVQYDGNLVLDPAATPAKFKQFNFRGYLCPHPQTKGLAVQLEFSNYSNLKGFPSTFADLSNEFFQTTKFPKPPAAK